VLNFRSCKKKTDAENSVRSILYEMLELFQFFRISEISCFRGEYEDGCLLVSFAV
jgi:hypothetical protein